MTLIANNAKQVLNKKNVQLSKIWIAASFDNTTLNKMMMYELLIIDYPQSDNAKEGERPTLLYLLGGMVDGESTSHY